MHKSMRSKCGNKEGCVSFFTPNVIFQSCVLMIGTRGDLKCLVADLVSETNHLSAKYGNQHLPKLFVGWLIWQTSWPKIKLIYNFF